MNSKTKLYSELKPRAIALRSQGMMFSEIRTELGRQIPKGTLSGWLKHVELTDDQKARIRQIMTQNGLVGRQMGAFSNHQKRLDRLADIRARADAEYPIHVRNPHFLAGLVLYLAEGTKKSEVFMFMNSDPMLIKCMIDWIVTVGGVDFGALKFRLYIHEIYAHENCEQFWQDELAVSADQFLRTIYKPTERVYKKNPAYKGCLRIEVKGGNELYWKTMAWRDCFYDTIRR